MFLRISDRLQSLLQKKLEAMDCTWSTNINLHNLNLKKYIAHLETIGIKKPFRTEKNDIILRDMNGKEKQKVFESIDLIRLFPNMNKIEENNSQWKDFDKILSGIKKDDPLITFNLKDRTYEWYHMFSLLNFCSEITPYCHIFGMHLFEQVEHLKSKGININRFSMQGLEKQNDFLTHYFHRSSNKSASFVSQIMKKRSRIELLTFHRDIKGIIMRNKNQLKISDVAVLESDDQDENMLYEDNIMD